jgi:hypothetical protein
VELEDPGGGGTLGALEGEWGQGRAERGSVQVFAVGGSCVCCG